MKETITFDSLAERLKKVFKDHVKVFLHTASRLRQGDAIVVNRDLFGRVSFVVPQSLLDDPQTAKLFDALKEELVLQLGPHAAPDDAALLGEMDLAHLWEGAPSFDLFDPDDSFPVPVKVVDRLASEAQWSSVSVPVPGPPRIAFYSLKGGVGRSTALAVAAWSLAKQGKRVLVLDLDLESPGLSSFLTRPEEMPQYGIVDWLVEDLVGAGDPLLDSMVASIDVRSAGELLVVPAHGSKPGEYLLKLGRIWMPSLSKDGSREPWFRRLGRMLQSLVDQRRPDIILLDARAGLNEASSSTLLSLGASRILLFATNSEHTWAGYGILFDHWRRSGQAYSIRNRLQMVAAMVPETGADVYLNDVRGMAWKLFTETLYDEVPPDAPATEYFNFDLSDTEAPHYAWPVLWHRGFNSIATFHEGLRNADDSLVTAVFGPIIRGLQDELDIAEA